MRQHTVPTPEARPLAGERRQYERRASDRRGPSLPTAAATTILGLMLIATGAIVWLFLRAGSTPGGQGAVLGAGLVVLGSIAAVVLVLSRLRHRELAAVPAVEPKVDSTAALADLLLEADRSGHRAWLVVATVDGATPDAVGRVTAMLQASLPAGALVTPVRPDEVACVVPGVDTEMLESNLHRLAGPGVTFAAVDADGTVRDAEGAEVVDLDGLLDEIRFLTQRVGPGRVAVIDPETRMALRSMRNGSIGDRVEVLVQLQRALTDRRIVGAKVSAQVPGGDDHGPSVDLAAVAAWCGRRFGAIDAVLAGIDRSARRIPPAGIRLWFEASADDVAAPGGADELWRRLSKVGLTGTPLGVEITGRVADVVALRSAIADLHANGIHVAVPLTGPGAVALADAAVLDADRLLVDAAIVEGIGAGEPGASGVGRAVAQLAKSTGAELAALEVGSIAAAPMLADVGVDVAQVQLTEPWAPRRPVAERSAA